MKISILLPYKENYTDNYAGAVSLFINDTTKLSKFKKTCITTIFISLTQMKIHILRSSNYLMMMIVKVLDLMMMMRIFLRMKMMTMMMILVMKSKYTQMKMTKTKTLRKKS